MGEGRASLDPEERHGEDIVERWKLLSDRIADTLGLNVFVWGC